MGMTRENQARLYLERLANRAGTAPVVQPDRDEGMSVRFRRLVARIYEQPEEIQPGPKCWYCGSER